MQPRVFIGSSVEGLNVAYSIQENLEHCAEITVWDQGVFQLSKYTIDSLVDTLDEMDFGIFIFSPDDIAIIRKTENQVVRDNVLFELGMYIGKLGKERSFIVIPRGIEDFHLPTDLLGLTPATFEPKREDENLNAALGPACNKIRKAFEMHGLRAHADAKSLTDTSADQSQSVQYDENDIRAILKSWFGARSSSQNSQVIYYNKVDEELKLITGSAKKHLTEAASMYNYQIIQEGNNTILFRKVHTIGTVATRSARSPRRW